MPSSPAFAKYPEHKISLLPFDGTVRVRLDDIKIAATINGLKMIEGTYSPVYYIPWGDCQKQYFSKSAHTTFCPFKGTASYWDLVIDSKTCGNCVWGYENPLDEMAKIAGYVAFYSEKVSIEIA